MGNYFIAVNVVDSDPDMSNPELLGLQNPGPVPRPFADPRLLGVKITGNYLAISVVDSDSDK
jgi:hypothetical protein